MVFKRARRNAKNFVLLYNPLRSSLCPFVLKISRHRPTAITHSRTQHMVRNAIFARALPGRRDRDIAPYRHYAREIRAAHYTRALPGRITLRRDNRPRWLTAAPYHHYTRNIRTQLPTRITPEIFAHGGSPPRGGSPPPCGSCISVFIGVYFRHFQTSFFFSST